MGKKYISDSSRDYYYGRIINVLTEHPDLTLREVTFRLRSKFIKNKSLSEFRVRTLIIELIMLKWIIRSNKSPTTYRMAE